MGGIVVCRRGLFTDTLRAQEIAAHVCEEPPAYAPPSASRFCAQRFIDQGR